MTEHEEIEVEVIEVDSGRPGIPREQRTGPRQAGQVRTRIHQNVMRLPKWLLPLLMVVGILVALLALVLFLLIGIPLLLVRALLRLLR